MGLFNEDCYQRLLEKQKNQRRKGRLREEKAMKKKAWQVTHPNEKRKRKRNKHNMKGKRRILHDSQAAQLLIVSCENATGQPNALLKMNIYTYEIWRARVVLLYCLTKYARCRHKELCAVYNISPDKMGRHLRAGRNAVTNPKKIGWQRPIAAMIKETYEPLRIKYAARNNLK